MNSLPRLNIALSFVLLGALALSGCARGPTFIPENQRPVIDRGLVEYPGGVVMKPVVRNLTAPVAVEIDPDGNLIIAEGGYGGHDVRIFGFRPDGTYFSIYPAGTRLPFHLPSGRFRIYGPVGGMALHEGKIYVSHRDADNHGVITALSYDGTYSTVVGNLPARGDHSVTDLAFGPTGRLWFGVGSATNSGVVGLDNWRWVKRHGEFSDRPAVHVKLNGYRFMTRNPDAGLFTGPDLAVTAPFQSFGESTRSHIRRHERPTAAIYSVNPAGGGLRLEAHGIRCPRGIAFNEFGMPYVTNNGMELRGTRPVKDDPDALLAVWSGTWYGWPDYTADLQPVTDERFQPPTDLAIRYGYPDVAFLIDHSASNDGEGLIRPRRDTLVKGIFAPLSGAAKFDFVPPHGPLGEYHGSAIVALSGDRAPFATSGRRLVGPIGFKVVRVDPTSREVEDLVRNTHTGPASGLPKGHGLLERPWAVKFAPDGRLYIVDFGEMETRTGRERVRARTGAIYVIEADAGPALPEPETAGEGTN